MFRSCLGIIFSLKRLTFGCIFCSKGRYMASKIKILGQNLALWEGHFDDFGVQKSRFLDILKVGLELFRSCLGIIFGLKRRYFGCIFDSKGRYMTSKIENYGPILGIWEGHFDDFQPKISILEVIYQPFEPKIHKKVQLVKPKILLKQFLNNSKTTFEKSRKCVFWAWKSSKWPSQMPKIWR